MQQDGEPDDAERRLTQWVRRYADPLRGYLWNLLADKSSVEDLLQEVFLRAWRGRSSYVEVGREKAYLFRIADRLAQDHRRRLPPSIDWNGDDALANIDAREMEPAEWLAAEENKRQLAEAIGLLNEPQKRTLLLRYFGELSFEEIACVLGCPLNTALSHARRGVERLRSLLVRETNS